MNDHIASEPHRTPPEIPSLLERATRGALWSVGAQWFRQLVHIGLMAILARWLAPADFGRMAMIGVVTGLLSLLGEWGLGPAVIQRRELTQAHLRAAFWGSLLSGTLLMFVLGLGAPLVAAFYADAALIPLTLALAVNFPLVALATVPVHLLQRELQLGRLALVEIFSVVVAAGVAATLALRGAGAWSLVGQTLAASSATAVAAWALASVRGKDLWGGFPRTAFRELFRFGRSLVGINLLTHFSRNVDNALIGRFLGASELGYYTLSYRLMLFPVQNISWALARALFPALARVPDLPQVRQAYVRVIRGLALLAFPLMIGMALAAPELIRLLYGPQWERAVFLARILCALGALQAIGTTVGPLCLSQGRPDVLLRWNLLFAPAVGGSIALGLRWGLEGVVLAYASTSAAAWYFSHALANRVIALPMRTFLGALVPATWGTGLMAVAVSLLRAYLPQHPLTALGLQVGVGASVYALVLALFFEEVLSDIRVLARALGLRRAGMTLTR